MRHLLAGAAILLILAPTALADAAPRDDGRIGSPGWCDATWLGLSRTGQNHGESRGHYVQRCLPRNPDRRVKISNMERTRARDYCRDRWRDLRLSGRPINQTRAQFDEACAAIAPPDAAVGNAVATSATLGTTGSPATLAPLIVGAAALAATAVGSTQQDPPASP